MIRAGIGLPHFGLTPATLGIGAMATTIEAAGFDVWFSDHVVLIEEPASRYPFSADGRFFVPADDDWYDFVTTAAYVSQLVTEVDLGVGVCVAALRHPVELAKQLATLDRFAAGGMVVGLGAGWLTEEFEALGVPTKARGARLDHHIDLMRAVWTGAPPAGDYGPYALPEGVRSSPTPVTSTMPVLIGGGSGATLDRIAARGDGWLGMAPGGRVTTEQVRRVVDGLDRRCEGVGRDVADLEIAMRYGVTGRALADPDRLATDLAALVDVGVGRFIFDVGWTSIADTEARLGTLRDVVASLPRVPSLR